MPEEAIRFRVGDVTPLGAGFLSSPDILGISAEKSYEVLQPGKSVRPTGAHSFRLERPSTLDIIVNNALVRRIRLGPGNYNLSDLPLGAGANDVKLVIEDDTGARQTLEFTDFGGAQLAPGISEWSFAAGIRSYDQGIVDSPTYDGLSNYTVANKTSKAYGQRAYYFDQPVANAVYRTGVTPSVTGVADAQIDDQAAIVGAGFLTQTSIGFVSGEFGASENYYEGLGYALRASYGYDKFDWFGNYRSGVRVTGEYRSPNFGAVEGYQPAASYAAYAAASYTQQLPYDVSAGLSFSYYFMDGLFEPNSSDRWNATFSVSRQLWDNVSGSLSVGYGNDQAAISSTCCIFGDSGFQAFVRLAWTSDSHSAATAAYDTRSQAVQATYSQSSETGGVGSWTTAVDATAGANNESAINASAGYVANRADVFVSHSASVNGVGYYGPFSPLSTEERTSVGVATSFVYADGAWGIGRRVSNGFALVTPHPSLEGSPVVVGGTDAVVAESDWLGPAVVPSASPFRKARLNYDAPGAPAGYDLGSAAFEMKAPYKAGYSLQAGSAYTVTAMGTLLDTHGEPLPLLAGQAREANKENGRKVELFTNRAGRFGAQGLAPGKWIIEMPTEPEPSRYVIEIPEGVMGLHDAGTLKPEGGGQPQKPPIIEAEADNGTN